MFTEILTLAPVVCIVLALGAQRESSYSSRVRRLCLIDDYHRPEDPALSTCPSAIRTIAGSQIQRNSLFMTCQPLAEKNAAIPIGGTAIGCLEKK